MQEKCIPRNQKKNMPINKFTLLIVLVLLFAEIKFTPAQEAGSGKNLTLKEISDKIHITKNTVNMHRKQIMKKMNARNLAEMVKKSMENGLFSGRT